ncbi:hypothetical protein [Vibrio mediterranei]|uniref:Uncharacterized protein n=1 Tax=Vibrio mediterranei TaxID=689 RepID=A0ABX5D6X5_9VIBR|nr:hypothetical protein [Vibrio mediterranei]PCD85514.1 hypothetical protein COR52_26270 [Vibrio mediterranei]PRQ65397.1 hypothetical protein COR51_22500 [Vibrio mediterranei]
MDPLLLTSILALMGFALTLLRHILFKRQLWKLKQALLRHKQEHGIDDALWDTFNTQTKAMLRFWL